MSPAAAISEGTYNLLDGCVAKSSGHRVILVGEDHEDAFLGSRVCNVLAEVVRELGGRPSIVMVPAAGGPNNLPEDLARAMDDAENTVFVCRLGDLERFDGVAGEGTRTMCHLHAPSSLASPVARLFHGLLGSIDTLLRERNCRPPTEPTLDPVGLQIRVADCGDKLAAAGVPILLHRRHVRRRNISESRLTHCQNLPLLVQPLVLMFETAHLVVFSAGRASTKAGQSQSPLSPGSGTVVQFPRISISSEENRLKEVRNRTVKNLVNDIVAADRRIKAIDGGVRETPLDESDEFSDRTGASFLLKGEHLQRTGSFKFRGALNKVLCLNDEDRERGIVAASSGNHGRATAQAARMGGVDATIYLPESVSPLKHSNIKRLGANTVLVPGDAVEGERAARAVAEREGKTYVSPYADLDVIAGQGTVGLELADECPDLAVVYVCVGGGGLIAGIGSYLKTHRPDVEIIGCWAENTPAMHLCMEKGEIHDTPETHSLSDGTAGSIEEGAITFPLCQQVIDRHLLIGEAEIAGAMRDMAAIENFIIEGSAGVALAAALKTASDYQGRKIAVVVCGRNISLDTFRSVLEMG